LPRADVLLVSHHCSRTSSSKEFIGAASPRRAVIATGYRNRFGHPNREVLARYRSRGTASARTDLDGAVTVRPDASSERVGPGTGASARRSALYNARV